MSRLGRSFDRVRQMSGSELRARAGAAVRREANHLAWAIRPAAWRREDFARILDPTHPLHAEVAGRTATGDWHSVHARVSRHFAGRSPRFVLDPSSRDALVRTVAAAFPDAAADARLRAERVIAGRVDLLGYRGLSFADPRRGGPPGEIDWHWDPVHDRREARVHWSRVPFLSPAGGDHKIIWELNRHQHWLTLGRAFWLTGDERCRTTFRRQLAGWLRANPPFTGTNWASMLELSLRSISWIWALHFFAGAGEDNTDRGPEPSPWTVDLLVALDRQLSLVERTLSTWFSPNTHLIGEGLALYVAGQSLPELARAARWAHAGRRILLQEAHRQVGEDGGHAELSTHYHRYALDFYLLALAVADVTGDAAVRDGLAGAVAGLAHYARRMARDDLHLPHIGDDDGGMLLPICGRAADDITDSLALAGRLLPASDLAGLAPTEEVLWMTRRGASPSAAAPPAPVSVSLPSSGYVVSRTARGDHLVMDVGRLGYLNAGHAHADALSMTLAVGGHPLLIDPGTGCYTIEPRVRNAFRTTRGHNTLTLDGRPQSEPGGPFSWATAAAASLHAWRSNAAFDYVDGSHDGYAPARHRRAVLARPGVWLVVDWVLGPGAYDAALHWHLDPLWRVQAVDGRILADHPSGACAWILLAGAELHSVVGDAGGLGWCAPVYGRLEPTTTLHADASGRAPLVFVTAIVDGAVIEDGPGAACADVPGLEAAPIHDASGLAPPAVAIRLQTPQWTDTAMFEALAEDEAETAPPLRRADDIETDARMACVRRGRWGGRVDVWMVDGSLIRGAGGMPLVERPRMVRDLHVTCAAPGGRGGGAPRMARRTGPSCVDGPPPLVTG